jgi:hypothetical protein
MHLKQIGWDGINCIYLTPDREKMIGCCEHGKKLLVVLDVGNSVTA